jgi:hypothetical protein
VFRNGKGGQTSLKTLKSVKINQISLPKATMKLTLLLLFIFYFSASAEDVDYGEIFNLTIDFKTLIVHF